MKMQKKKIIIEGLSKGRISKRKMLELDGIPDDLLAAEILPRLPDSLTAVRCGAVSHLWRSLLTAPDFIPNFTRRRPQPPSYAMLIEYKFHRPGYFQHVSSPEYLFVNGSHVTSRVSAYGSRSESLILESACDDFMLFKSTPKLDPKTMRTTRHLHIRNFVTGQSLAIPELPPGMRPGCCKLVSHPASTASDYNFRIVDIAYYSKDGERYLYYYSIFSSETGRWTEQALGPALHQKFDVVDVNGVLFWLDDFSPRSLVVFDAFLNESPWTFVPLPVDLLVNQYIYCGLPVDFGPPNEVQQLGLSKFRVHIGSVQGMLFIAQLFRVVGAHYVLRIWKCTADYRNRWLLVHELQISPGDQNTNWVYFLSFDAEDRDAVFLCHDCDVFRYSISSGKSEKVFRLSCLEADEDESIRNSLPRFAHVFNVQLPVWHTSLPTLPSV